MTNRRKDKRNQKIMELVEKGWRHKSIANMFKMKESAVDMVIFRARKQEKLERLSQEVSKNETL